MTSQINPNNIDGTYPVAGQDNDSQGFRDNFTNIRNNLTFTKAEIEDLQNKVVLKSALLNTTLDNDFAGNAMVGPSLTAWRETYNNIGSISGSVTINFVNGNFQKITMSGSTTLTFSFPSNAANQYASIKLWVNNTNSAWTLTLPNAVTLGDPDTIAGLSGSPPVITFNAAQLSNANDFFFEFYTVDGGTTIGIKDLTRNRDVDLSGLSITGNLSLDNITASGNIVTTNGVFWAANGNPFVPTITSLSTSGVLVAGGNIVAASSTTSTSATTGALVVVGGAGVSGNIYATGNVVMGSGVNSNVVIAATTEGISTSQAALVVKGGVGIAGNVVIGGNTAMVGGTVNVNYAYVTLTNNQDYSANVLYKTIYLDTASSATIANAYVTLPSGAEDGRELVLSFLAPITSVFVNKGGAGNSAKVQWVANNIASSGNTVVRLTWSASNSNWLLS